jgi:hypothetical protein
VGQSVEAVQKNQVGKKMTEMGGKWANQSRLSKRTPRRVRRPSSGNHPRNISKMPPHRSTKADWCKSLGAPRVPKISNILISLQYSGAEGRHCPGLRGFYCISDSGHFLRTSCGLTHTSNLHTRVEGYRVWSTRLRRDNEADGKGWGVMPELEGESWTGPSESWNRTFGLRGL